jgi:hypothetical protein
MKYPKYGAAQKRPGAAKQRPRRRWWEWVLPIIGLYWVIRGIAGLIGKMYG